MKSVQTIRDFIKNLTESNGGAKFVSLVTHTRKLPGKGMTKKSRADGTPNPYTQGVERRAIGRFILGFDYEKNVNAQREREGIDQDFVAQPMWVSKAHPEGAGRHDEKFPRFIVSHVDSLKDYLIARPYQKPDGNIVKERDSWFDVATGRKIIGEELASLKVNFLDKPGNSDKQGTVKEIPYRVFEFSNVVAAKFRQWCMLTS